eukprot:6480231-Amphidinium_carterae.1
MSHDVGAGRVNGFRKLGSNVPPGSSHDFSGFGMDLKRTRICHNACPPNPNVGPQNPADHITVVGACAAE